MTAVLSLTALIPVLLFASPPVSFVECKPAAQQCAEALDPEATFSVVFLSEAFAPVPKFIPPKLAVECAGRVTLHTFRNLAEALEEKAYRSYPSLETATPPGESTYFLNPFTKKRLVLDTSSGGGSACCEQATFYALVDPCENIFWIREYHATFSEKTSAWFGPFAASNPATAADVIPKDEASLRASALEFAEHQLTQVMKTWSAGALGAASAGIRPWYGTNERFLEREAKTIGKLQANEPYEVQLAVVRDQRDPAVQALVRTWGQFEKRRARVHAVFKRNGDRWALYQLLID